MSQNNPAVAWPPLQKRHHHRPTSENATLSCQDTPTRNPDIPCVPLRNKVNQKHYRNGFETKPKTPAYRPYTLNSPGFP